MKGHEKGEPERERELRRERDEEGLWTGTQGIIRVRGMLLPEYIMKDKWLKFELIGHSLFWCHWKKLKRDLVIVCRPQE